MKESENIEFNSYCLFGDKDLKQVKTFNMDKTKFGLEIDVAGIFTYEGDPD